MPSSAGGPWIHFSDETQREGVGVCLVGLEQMESHAVDETVEEAVPHVQGTETANAHRQAVVQVEQAFV